MSSADLVSLVQQGNYEALEKIPEDPDLPSIIGITAAKLGKLEVLLWLHD
jgi:hypothetical protein